MATHEQSARHRSSAIPAIDTLPTSRGWGDGSALARATECGCNESHAQWSRAAVIRICRYANVGDTALYAALTVMRNQPIRAPGAARVARENQEIVPRRATAHISCARSRGLHALGLHVRTHTALRPIGSAVAVRIAPHRAPSARAIYALVRSAIKFGVSRGFEGSTRRLSLRNQAFHARRYAERL